MLKSKLCKDVFVSTPDSELISFIDKSYNGTIKTFQRDPSYARFNVGIEDTLLELLYDYCKKNLQPEYILVLYIEYPFKESWQIDEALDTALLFDVDVVDGVILNDDMFYRHDGSGLKPLAKKNFAP